MRAGLDPSLHRVEMGQLGRSINQHLPLPPLPLPPTRASLHEVGFVGTDLAPAGFVRMVFISRITKNFLF